MLSYFHKNKAKYNQGQIAPFFILILVIIIMMALVTLNLSKVSLVKTDSSNAVDSGGLAAGSVMANVFNVVTVANSQMIAHYWQFYAAISISFTIALVFLTLALMSAKDALKSAKDAAEKACDKPCKAIDSAKAAATKAAAAIGPIGKFIKTTIGIMVSVTAYHIAQYFFYKNIKKTAMEGRRQAMEIGQRFAFSNSGISSKLRDGSPAGDVTEPEKRNNYRNTFSEFLDNTIKAEDIGDSEECKEYAYPWIDGQERRHSVRVQVCTEPVDEFMLTVTVLPLAAELGLLGASLGLAYSAKGELAAAAGSYTTAAGFLVVACGCQVIHYICKACCGPESPQCCACAKIALACWKAACAAAKVELSIGRGANSAAISAMTAIFPLMGSAWAGLLPGPTVSSKGVNPLTFIIAWIDDIVHDRRVRTDTWQSHQGEDLGLWETKYPETHSFSIVNFEGMGKIYKPKPNFDASIEATDQIGGGR